MKRLLGPIMALLLLSVSTTTALAPSVPRETTGFVPVILDFPVTEPPTPTGRPYSTLQPVPIVIDLTTPKPILHTSDRLSGVASWYCLTGVSRCTIGHSGGMYAAIRRDLLFLRGDRIKVCTSTKCITVTVIDCNCGASANLIDLYSDAFKQLAPLSVGRVKVYIVY